MSVPWPSKPLLGLYHVRQAKALSDVGIHTKLFSPAPAVPQWLGRLIGGRVKAHAGRPLCYCTEGVVTHSPRTPYAFPRAMRMGVAEIAPAAVAAMASIAVRPALSTLLDGLRPHAVLAHGILPWGRLVTRLAERRGFLPAFIEHSAGDVSRLVNNRRLARFYCECAERAKAVFVVSPKMADELHAIGVRNAVYVPNGADAPLPEDLASPRPAELADRVVVLAVGHYYRRKNFELLAQAFDTVAERHPTAVLVMVTAAPASLVDAVDRCRHADRIVLLPPMHGRELSRMMCWCDLFALPSDGESFGLVYAEAMACGKPVLMSHDCGLASAIRPARIGENYHGAHGWLVDPLKPCTVAAAIDDALMKWDRLAAMGAAAREKVAGRFTWDRNASVISEALFGPAAVRS